MRRTGHVVVLFGMAITALHATVAEALVQDVVGAVAVIGVMNREFKAECETRFPDLRERVSSQYDAAPVNSVSISEYVNDRKYRNPILHSMLAAKREMTKDGEYGAAKRSDCEHPEELFGRLTSLMAMGASEKRDYEMLLNWAGQGTSPTPEEKAPVSIDGRIVEQLRSTSFLDKYPRGVRDNLSINPVRNIQLAQYVAREIQRICNSKWPEGASRRDGLLSAWSFLSIKAITVVNGRPYDNPYIHQLADQYWIPQLIGKEEQQREASCKNFDATLERTVIRAGLKWYPQLIELLTVPQ